MSDDNYEALEKCLQLIPRKVLEEDSISLNNYISLEEAKWAINSLANDKSPKCHGLTTEFYNTIIDRISNDLLAFYEGSFNRGSLGKRLNKGMIKLIPKNGDKA